MSSDISNFKKLEELCKEFLNDSDKDFGNEFFRLIPYQNIFGFITFEEDLIIDSYEFSIKVTKFPFSNPRIKVKVYNVEDKKDSKSKTYIIQNFKNNNT
ncbi:MAG: hypothetical protein AABX55_03130 [Nanoarchaeota archaeon]